MPVRGFGGLTRDNGLMLRISRSLVAAVAAGVMLSGCSLLDSASDDSSDEPVPQGEEITFESLKLDWPTADGKIEFAEIPERPEGVNEKRYDRLTKALTTWAEASAVNEDVRASDDPAAEVAKLVSEPAVGKRLQSQAGTVVSPKLAAANVFAEGVEVEGDPLVTSAWEVGAGEEDGDDIVRITLQTRAAYLTKVDGGPDRVIGVLRTHTLTSGVEEKGPVTVGYAWQEFGASDCVLALEDALEAESSAEDAEKDLATFIEAGNDERVNMPELEDDDVVNDDFKERCESGTT